MKRLLAISFIFISLFASAQMYDPVQWVFSKEKISENEIELQFKAHIEENWHLYSQHLPAGVDAYPTEFIFLKTENYELISEMFEPEPIRKADAMFDNLILPYFEDEVVFRKRIRVESADDFKISGEISFMSCDESQCVFPPLTPFSFDIEGVENGERGSMWWLFFIAFMSGFAALITPCVFPMIPLTVSFFTKKSKTKAKGIANAIIYGISIICLLYTSPSP